MVVMSQPNPAPKSCSHLVLQVRYKEAGKAEAAHPVYHQLADTLETQLARELTDMQSNVSLKDQSRPHRTAALGV